MSSLLTDVSAPFRTGPVCRLGEGLLVSAGSAYWLDILEQRVFRFESGELLGFDLPVEGTVILARRGDRVLVGSSSGLAWFEFGNATLTPCSQAAEPLIPKAFRTNDGCRLPEGGFLIGTMHREQPLVHPGTLLRVAADGETKDLGAAILIPNTFITLDDGSILISDSGTRCIFRYRFSTGFTTFTRTPWYQHDGAGTPDGGCRLPDGRLAISMWDEARVAIFSPDGEPVDSVAVPADRPTNCKFDESTGLLWVTSATEGMGADRLSSSPYSGYTFALEFDLS